jgi:hypothetical protein
VALVLAAVIDEKVDVPGLPRAVCLGAVELKAVFFPETSIEISQPRLDACVV